LGKNLLRAGVLEGGDELLRLLGRGGDELLEILVVVKELRFADLLDLESLGVESLLFELLLVHLLLLLGVLRTALLPQPVHHLHRNDDKTTINNNRRVF
jgi:hypothetical protein